jgi:uracil phosphoribosyltransferase
LPGFLDCIDDAEIAHLGFYRDPSSLQPVPYYANMPRTLADRDVFVLDPMLATGNSGSAALALLESREAKAITFVCLIAAPEGIETIGKAHPDVRIVTAAIDERLNDHGYIMPGLGDAGDRMFGSATSLPVSARPPGD